MVAPIVAGLAVAGTAAYSLYKAGKSRGIKKGKNLKEEEEVGQEVKDELKQELLEEAQEEFEREQSKLAHERAVSREPPVERGDTVSVGVKELRNHHSGKETAVCKKEGFVIFVETGPNHIGVGDVIVVRITSFGRNKSSAEATYIRTVSD